MFDTLLKNLSLRRSAAGIYYELRTLRQMLEIYFQAAGLESLAERRRREKTDNDPLHVNPPSEEELAAKEAERIHRDLMSGRDPGTSWRPDPER